MRIKDSQPMVWFVRLGVVLILGLNSAAEAAKPLRPNVIIILADDLGWGDLSCYGNTKFKTPNLDRMAAEGARLTDFYTPCPYCAPTRASLMTGRYQFRSGITANPTPNQGMNDIGLPDR